MLYRTMPQSRDQLSILGFGCMRLPVKDRQIDLPRATRQLRSAIDRGVNYVDTAWPYHGGQSETFLAQALQDGYRQRVKLATKLPSWMVKSRADMDFYLNAQLKKLATDRIDYYLLHSLQGASWDNLQSLRVLEFLDQAKKDGRIGFAGFSYHGSAGDFRRIVDAYPWTCCQIQFNYLDEQNQAGADGLQYAAAKGLGVIVMEPLRGGNLGLPTPPAAVAALWQSAPTQRTPVEWALRWLWNRPEVTLVLSGMNDEAHIDENLRLAADARPNSLSPDELALVQKVAQTYRDLMRVPCTGCGYCLPCPADVQIPVAFEGFNKAGMFGGLEELQFFHALRLSGSIGGGPPGYASQCTQCNSCADHCPQHIDIPAMLARVAAELEGPGLHDRLAQIKKLFQM
jgi:uncharacterized protein